MFSDSAENDFRDGEYAKLRVGYAYRSIGNERLSLLFGYTFLSRFLSEDQVDANGNEDGPLQQSHVLSMYDSYDLTDRLTFVGKVGYRSIEVADRGTSDFTDNTATLALARLDWHVIHKRVLRIEGRVLHTRETETDETGLLVGVYRHVGKNAKIGLGYEWGSVSDDLTDLSYDNQAAFLNSIAKL